MMQRRSSSLLFLSLAALLLVGGQGAARADKKTVKYQYLVGADFLVGPDVARAANGDSIALAGSGTFTVDPKFEPGKVTGGGTFVHRNAARQALASGTWVAKELRSFVSFGTLPFLPPTFEGGKAVIEIELLPAGSEEEIDATLKVFCIIGNVPPGVEEGIQLFVEDGPNFTEHSGGEFVDGQTLFIRLP
jgi:hypothetical protein